MDTLDFLNEPDFDFELGADDSQLSEVYLADGAVGEGDNGLIWKEILREGEWAYRPGPGQKPIPVPLKVVSGKASTKQEIGMADLIEAFEDQAVDHVTIPTSHADKPHENTGYVKKLKVIEKDGKRALSAGLDFTEPDIKGKASRGTIANTSSGIIFDYVKKDSGKTYPQVLGHVALTNKPWINGMKPFGMSEELGAAFSDEETVAIILSDEAKAQQEAHEAILLRDFTSDRRKKLAEKGHAMADGSFPIENEQDLKNAIRLWSHASNKEAAKRHIISRAKALGKTNLLPDDWKVNLSDINTNEAMTEVNSMATEETKTEETRQEETSTSPAPDTVLSDEAREALKTELSEEFKSQIETEKAEKEELERKVRVMEVDKRVNELKEQGFSDYPGLLKEIRGVMLADKGQKTLVLSEGEGDAAKEVELSVTGAIERVISALPTKDGKINFGEQASSTEDKDRPKVDTDDNLSDEEKVAAFAEDLGLPGFEKPKKEDKDGDA